jgi:hypothetical protein
MLAFEDDSHFEREDEIAVLKRTCTRMFFMPSASILSFGVCEQYTKNFGN